jgi:hypothetical protein
MFRLISPRWLTQRRWLSLLVVFVLYTLLAAITLRTLLGQFNSAVPGGKDTDYYQFLWNYWWIGHALSNGVSPMWTDYTLFPHVSNLSIHTLAPIWYPLYAVTQPIIGTIAAGNLMVLLGFSLTGTAMFAWLRRRLEKDLSVDTSGASPTLDADSPSPYTGRGLGGGVALAFLGGLAYAFSPYMMTHAAYIQLNLTPLWWFPVVLLLWEEIAFLRRLPRWVSAILLGLVLWGLWLTDLQFIVWLPFAAAGYVLWTLWNARHERRWLRLMGWGLVAAGIMAVLAYIYPLSALLQVNLSNTDEFPPAGMKTLLAYSMPPEAFIGLAPSVENKTLGHILPWLTWGAIILLLVRWWKGRRSGHIRNAANPDQTIEASEIYSSLMPHTSYLIPSPPAFFWLLLTLIPLIFALGPEVTIGGLQIPTPFMLLHTALNGQYRIPARLTGVGLFLLITFLVMAWQKLLQSFPLRLCAFASARSLPMGLRYAFIFFLAFLLLADVGALSPFPTKPIPDYAIHHQIADESGDFVIMDVPVGTQYGWTGIGKGYFSMVYGTVHQHRMVNGWLARIPYSTLVYYMDSPLFSWLADTRDPNPQEQEAAANELAEYREAWPIGYIIAYRDWIDPYKQTRWIGWLNMQPGFCPAQSTPDADLIWWRNTTLGCTPTLTESIDMGTGGDWAFIGDGWYDPETIGGSVGRWAGEEAALRLTLDANVAYELTFTALAFGEGRTVTLGGQGSFIESIPISDANWADYTVTIPAGALPDGLLYLRHNGAISAQERGLSDDTRLLSAAYTRFALHPLE